jgi:hypothetical protein
MVQLPRILFQGIQHLIERGRQPVKSLVADQASADRRVQISLLYVFQRRLEPIQRSEHKLHHHTANTKHRMYR